MSDQDFDTVDLSLLAEHLTSPVGQRALYKLDPSAYLSSLATNPELDPELWEELYLRAELSDAITLLRYAPSEKQASRLLKEKNEYITSGAIEGGVRHLTSQVTEEFLSTQENITHFLPPLLSTGQLTEELAHELWQRLYAEYKDTRQDTYNYVDALTAVVAKYKVLSDTEVIEVLQRLYKEVSRPDSGYSFNICQMIDHRPTLIPLLLQSPYRENFFSAVAVSQHLRTDTAATLYDAISDRAYRLSREAKAEILGSLSRNPAVPYGLRAKALGWINHASLRATAQSFSHSLNDQRIHYLGLEFLGLKPIEVTWDKAPAGRHGEIVKHLDHLGISRFPTLEALKIFQEVDSSVEAHNKAFIQQTLSPYLDQLGPMAWDLFLALMENWHGSMDALLEVVTTTITK